MSIETEKGVLSFEEKHLLDTCMHQFTDKKRYLAELLINSFDARSKTANVSGSETENSYSIIAEDFGHGMNADICENICLTKFRSYKKHNDAVGEHGLGLISAGADENEIAMVIHSYTKSEYNLITIDGNIAKEPDIVLKTRQGIFFTSGTTIHVIFRKPKNFSLRSTLLSFKNYIADILRFLPMDILFYIPSEDKTTKEVYKLANQKWDTEAYLFHEKAGNYSYQVAIKPGINLKGTHAYQKNVLVTKNFEELKLPDIPNMQVMINSSDYKLPFGRDQLILNPELEESLYFLKMSILKKHLPQAFEKLLQDSDSQLLIETICIGLLKEKLQGPWENYKLFKVHSKKSPLFSLNDFKMLTARRRDIFYIRENTEIKGIDFSKVYPVLDNNQSASQINFILNEFRDNIKYIETSSGVYVVPVKKEKNSYGHLLDHLKFDFTGLLNIGRSNDIKLPSGERSENIKLRNTKENEAAGEKSKSLRDEILSICFELGYLLNNQDSTPNYEYKFYHSGNQVVFNLYHPDIRKIVEYKDPKLAAHRAICIALTEDSGILHKRAINPRVIDTVLVIDLISRFNTPDTRLLKTLLHRFDDSSEN